MAEVRLKAQVRELSGKGVARKARARGKVPAILYGRGMDNVSIELDRRQLVTALHTEAGMNVLLDLEIDGTTTLALTKELQRDPVLGTLLHADFIKVDRKRAVEVEVPVHLVGESVGAKQGGVLEHPLFAVHVRCLPTEVPEAVEADVSALAIGDSLRVSGLPSDGTFEILTDPDTVVASVAAPVSEEELEAMEAAAAVEAAGGVEAMEEPEVAEEVEEAEVEAEGESEAPPEGEDQSPE
jgi:large subunit ribosomal protein L25